MIFKCQHNKNLENRVHCRQCLKEEIILEILSTLPKPHKYINNHSDKRYLIGRNDMLEVIIKKLKEA